MKPPADAPHRWSVARAEPVAAEGHRHGDREHDGARQPHDRNRVLERPDVVVSGACGLPNSSRTAAMRTLTGFHDATPCSQLGMDWIGTNALLTNVSGNTITNIRPMTASGDRTTMPSQVPSQIIADENNNKRRNAPMTSGTDEWVRQPTSNPAPVSTTIDRTKPASSAT